jgi:ankyrin repeat protein
MSWFKRLFRSDSKRIPYTSAVSVEGGDDTTPASKLQEQVTRTSGDPAQQLNAAARKGDLSEAKRLLSSGASFDPEALGLALLLTDKVEIAKALLAAGADVNFQDKEFRGTALLSAVRGGHLDLIRLLVSAGADPTLADRNDHSPLRYISNCSPNPEISAIAEVLRDARPAKVDCTTLIAAATSGAVAIVQQALEAGIDVNSTNEYDSPALLIAAQNNHPEIVKMLLAHGASPNTATKGDAETALTAAVCGGSVEAVRLLIAAGADVNKRRRYDNGTPLGVADWLGKTEIWKILRDAGAKS